MLLEKLEVNEIMIQKNNDGTLNEVRDKKVLFMGAIGGMAYAVRIAKEMGIHTVVLDYYSDSQAKEYADKSYDVSTTDFETIYKIMENEHIDGVFSGFSDVNLRGMEKVCGQFGLSCYANKEQISYTQDKNLFKELCNRYDVPTPKTYDMSAVEKISYPVIVKPADAYAAKGITICDSADKLQEAIEYAKGYSQKGDVTIEDYIEGAEVMVHYAVVNGKFRITSVFERRIAESFDASGKDIAPVAIFNNDEFRKLILPYENKLAKMYKSIGMENAVGFLQGKIRDESVYFFEMALRFGGNVSELFNKYFDGVDLIAEFVKYSVTGKMEAAIADKLTTDWNGFDCNISLFLKPGIISSMEGENFLDTCEEIVDIQRYASIGDKITQEITGTYKAIAYRLVCITDSKESLINLISKIQGKIAVYDENHHDLIDWELLLTKLN